MSKQASNPLRETITPARGSDGPTPLIGVSTNPGQEVGVGNALLPNPGVSNPLLTPNPSPSLLVANHLDLALVGQRLGLLCSQELAETGDEAGGGGCVQLPPTSTNRPNDLMDGT
ncbi:hypothetical protein As57867_022367, partial [Aphanomyces stellatus]